MAHRLVRTRSGRLKKISGVALDNKIKAEERQHQALELRKAGATYKEIADALGYYNEGGAKKAVDAVTKRTVFDLAEDIVTLDLQRLDEFQKLATHRLRTTGDLSQIDRIMRIMDKRYQLAGVSAETTKKIQEAYGLEGVGAISNQGVMVVQVGHTDQSDFIKKMMLAANINPESEEAKVYLERVEDRTVDSPRELTTGTTGVEDAAKDSGKKKKRKVVRSKGKKKIVVKKKKTAGASEDLPIEGVYIGGSYKGVPIGGINTPLPSTNPLVEPQYNNLEEVEIIDAEIVD